MYHRKRIWKQPALNTFLVTKRKKSDAESSQPSSDVQPAVKVVN